MSKINRNAVIGPLTAEQANSVVQIFKRYGEVTEIHGGFLFSGSNGLFFYNENYWRFIDGSCYLLKPNISYNDFVAKMSVPDKDKWLNTKWDVRDWTVEQKNAFQKECFRLGVGWNLEINMATAYNINNKGRLGFWESDPIYGWNDPKYGTEKKWEDMFPDSFIEVGNPTQDVPEHECWAYYSHTMKCCLKCNPEKNLFKKNLYAIKGTDNASYGIPDPNAIRPSSELWGILDESRRRQEFIEEMKRKEVIKCLLLKKTRITITDISSIYTGLE